MPEPDTRAWWAEVEHMREPLERRRAARTVKTADGGRRTVKIRGQAVPGAPSRKLHVAGDAERLQVPSFAAPRRRPQRRAVERLGGRPDRIAAWAVGCGLLLAIVAATTGHG
jgi:hypothetical protein